MDPEKAKSYSFLIGQENYNFKEITRKDGYINNPFWKSPATIAHEPCGYWRNLHLPRHMDSQLRNNETPYLPDIPLDVVWPMADKPPYKEPPVLTNNGEWIDVTDQSYWNHGGSSSFIAGQWPAEGSTPNVYIAVYNTGSGSSWLHNSPFIKIRITHTMDPTAILEIGSGMIPPDYNDLIIPDQAYPSLTEITLPLGFLPYFSWINLTGVGAITKIEILTIHTVPVPGPY